MQCTHSCVCISQTKEDQNEMKAVIFGYSIIILWIKLWCKTEQRFAVNVNFFYTLTACIIMKLLNMALTNMNTNQWVWEIRHNAFPIDYTAPLTKMLNINSTIVMTDRRKGFYKRIDGEWKKGWSKKLKQKRHKEWKATDFFFFFPSLVFYKRNEGR